MRIVACETKLQVKDCRCLHVQAIRCRKEGRAPDFPCFVAVLRCDKRARQFLEYFEIGVCVGGIAKVNWNPGRSARQDASMQTTLLDVWE